MQIKSAVRQRGLPEIRVATRMPTMPVFARVAAVMAQPIFGDIRNTVIHVAHVWKSNQISDPGAGD